MNWLHGVDRVYVKQVQVLLSSAFTNDIIYSAKPNPTQTKPNQTNPVDQWQVVGSQKSMADVVKPQKKRAVFPCCRSENVNHR